MVVDPLADHSNPEVCDPCGPNCPSTFLCYFDDTGRYIATSQALPPPFTYTFFTNGIVQPQYATLCSPTPPHGACDSPPSIAAATGQLHVLCRSVDGAPWETIRTRTQGWTTFGDVNNWANAVQGLDPRPLVEVGAAAIGQEVHVVCTSGDGRLWETIRHADGTWSTFGDVFNRAEVRTGLDPRPLIGVGAAAIGQEVHVVCTSGDGRLWETIRHADGTWSTFGDVFNRAEVRTGLDPRPLVEVGAAAIGQEVHVVCTSGDGRLWETIRHADGTWSTFGDVFNRAEMRNGLDPRPLVAVGAAAIP
jgi:hypothetical protein